ncbi:MAG: hypothetical protein AB7V46_15355 [Thermomicrobiales bacterium]
MMETILAEMNLPPEVRETFFPKPPEISPPRPPVAAQAPPPPPAMAPSEPASFDEMTLRRPTEVAQAATREIAAARETAVPRETVAARQQRRRAQPAASVQSLQGIGARGYFRTPGAARQAILAREVLGPPKAFQPDDQSPW